MLLSVVDERIERVINRFTNKCAERHELSIDSVQNCFQILALTANMNERGATGERSGPTGYLRCRTAQGDAARIVDECTSSRSVSKQREHM